MTINTYTIFIINLANPTQGFGSTHHGDGLNGNAIAEAGTLTVDDTGDVNICADAELLASFDDSGVGAYGLRDGWSVNSCRGYITSAWISHTVSIGGNIDLAAF